MFRSSGIDIGTTFISVFGYHKNPGKSKNTVDYETSVIRIRHEGQIAESLNTLIESLKNKDISENNDNNTSKEKLLCVFTGKAGKDIVNHLQGIYIDEALAVSSILSEKGNEWFGKEKGLIIDIGASSLTLYTVKDNRVIDIAQNTLCAAGTGLFLEEQAERLNIDLENSGVSELLDPPLIASRCTVFAKSDLIHHQQEGRSKDEMWSGLCRSLVISAVNTLFRGEEPQGKILICGGVSLNYEVRRWFKILYPTVQWIIPSHSESLIAMGASLTRGKPIDSLSFDTELSQKEFKRMPALTLKRSQYPFMSDPLLDIHDNEIRIHEDISKVNEILLGMDIGSTSTKLAVLDAATLIPIFDVYGRTSGDPVNAARKVFASFYDILHDKCGERILKVKAFGTTGSGRKLVGKIFGADHIVNEISAHGKGTAHYYPDAETIFEIGGQDAKYIRLNDSYVADVNMNYVCAAGTGSFVEEQARKLGFKVQEIGHITENIAPPVTSDRCTVFMEQDLRALLKEGFSKEEALASVLYSVIRNYLNRVVGKRCVSEKRIVFQGATARNKGLVAAIENLLGVEVIVSRFCHLMGAIGAALMAREFMANKSHSQFVGKESINLEVTSRTESCHLCRNFCRINYISRILPNGSPTSEPAEHTHTVLNTSNEFSWGYQCGRDPEEKTRREISEYQLFRERDKAFYIKNEIKPETQPTHHDKNHPSNSNIPKSNKTLKTSITLVHTLTNFTYHPLWVRFFNRLGYPVSLSGLTDSKIKKYSSKIASADFCFPVKVALGHMIKALENPHPHFVFFPYMIADKTTLKTANSYFCPYVEGSASVVRSTLARNNIDTRNLLSPVIDLRLSDQDIASHIYDILKPHLDVKKKDVIAAFREAYRFWEQLSDQLEEKGTRLLDSLKETDQPVFILVGRPYNMHDRGLNLGIPEKIASMGFPLIPIDMLKLDTRTLSEGNYHNIFWKYGQRIMAAMQLAGKYRNVFPIFLSNFNCGPDSFLLSFAEEEMKGKPILVLELDEHDSDGGYLTRIEAFVDVVHSYMQKEEAKRKADEKMPHIYTAVRQPDLDGTIWMPPLHYFGYRYFSAVFRSFGYDCRNLELEDHDALVLGKKHLRGGECLPMTLTFGNFLKHIQNEPPGRRQILFMPTTEGPCRFGQYNLLERIVFHKLGLDHVDILSPSSINSYQGLPEKLRRQLMHGATASDVLFKMLTKVRPYERTKGDANQLFEYYFKKFEHILENKGKPLVEVKEMASKFASIPVVKEKKPLVGVLGEIYVRCNAFSNNHLIDIIEANGGEAWLAPVHEWLLYVAYMQRFETKKMREGLLKKVESVINNLYLFRVEQAYYKAAHQMLHDRMEPHTDDVVNAGARYLPQEFEGEAILTIGRSLLFAQQGASMVVNVSPFGCMPGTLSSSILLEIKDKFEIPFLSLFYDGDLDVNDKVASLLRTITMDRA